jgi:hypothetical protein
MALESGSMLGINIEMWWGLTVNGIPTLPSCKTGSPTSTHIKTNNNYRLRHGLFHIALVINTRP